MILSPLGTGNSYKPKLRVRASAIASGCSTITSSSTISSTSSTPAIAGGGVIDSSIELVAGCMARQTTKPPRVRATKTKTITTITKALDFFGLGSSPGFASVGAGAGAAFALAVSTVGSFEAGTAMSDTGLAATETEGFTAGIDGSASIAGMGGIVLGSVGGGGGVATAEVWGAVASVEGVIGGIDGDAGMLGIVDGVSGDALGTSGAGSFSGAGIVWAVGKGMDGVISCSMGGCEGVSSFWFGAASSDGVGETGLGMGFGKSSGGVGGGSIGSVDVGGVRGDLLSSMGCPLYLISRLDR